MSTAISVTTSCGHFTQGDIAVLLNNTAIVDQITSLEFADARTMGWEPVPGASHYRGLSRQPQPSFRGKLRQMPGRFDHRASYSDTTMPPLSDGFFYLVSVVTNGFEGPLGYSSVCVSAPNFNPCQTP